MATTNAAGELESPTLNVYHIPREYLIKEEYLCKDTVCAMTRTKGRFRSCTGYTVPSCSSEKNAWKRNY